VTGCAAVASGYLAVPATTALTAAALAAAFTAATLAVDEIYGACPTCSIGNLRTS
jgi:hypothetical protein